MISKLHITNFQSHRDSTLDMHSGVNIIVGRSDSGKTAIVRALKWLIWNRPSGDAFRSSWGGQTKVTIETTEGKTLSRSKDKGENQYRLDDLIFNAFGSDVPREITEALQVNEINLQQQFDSPFLLTDSPGEVASHFNKIAHIDQIDTSLKAVQSWVREADRLVETGKQQLEQQQESLKAFDHLPKFEADLEVLEGLRDQLIDLYRQVDSIADTVRRITTVQESIEQESFILKAETDVNKILVDIKLMEGMDAEVLALSNMVKRITDVETAVEEETVLIELENPVKELVAQISKAEELQNESDRLGQFSLRIRTTNDALTTWETKLQKLQDTFKKEMPDVCPLCEQPIKK